MAQDAGDEVNEQEDNNLNDEDPAWTPEKIDSEYEKMKDEDDSAKIHDNPRFIFIHAHFWFALIDLYSAWYFENRQPVTIKLVYNKMY